MSEQLEALLKSVQLSADIAALDAIKEGKTQAQITGAAMREAFLCAIGNGLITIVPAGEWPFTIKPSPPYPWPDL